MIDWTILSFYFFDIFCHYELTSNWNCFCNFMQLFYIQQCKLQIFKWQNLLSWNERVSRLGSAKFARLGKSSIELTVNFCLVPLTRHLTVETTESKSKLAGFTDVISVWKKKIVSCLSRTLFYLKIENEHFSGTGLAKVHHRCWLHRRTTYCTISNFRSWISWLYSKFREH